MNDTVDIHLQDARRQWCGAEQGGAERGGNRGYSRTDPEGTQDELTP